MPTIDERRRQVTLKIERAEHHIQDVEQQIRSFLETKPYEVRHKHDQQTRKLIYYLASVQPTPEGLPLGIGDAIQNLVSALDHLAYQLVCSDTADRPPKPHRIYFPVRDTQPQYEAEKHRKMEGALPDTFMLIDTLNPYRGGNDPLWTLLSLNNIDKHRLIFTVGSQNTGAIDVARYMAQNLSPIAPPEFRSALEAMSLFIVPADKGFPLAAGFEIFIGGVDEPPDPKQRFLFDVAFNEPGIAEGKPVVETLKRLKDAVEDALRVLTPRLK